jgi:two-component system phosphate regulon sensor histidine kinase PhoR
LFRRIQWRITFPITLLIIVAMVILGIYLVNSVNRSQIDIVRSFLEKEARTVVEAAVPSLQGHSISPNTLAKKLGAETNARITIMGADGTVLGDSEENPAAMDNHIARPEIRDALVKGYGESQRYSATIHQQMMYVAVPINNQGELLGIARVALPLNMVEQSVNEMTPIIILAILTTSILVILAIWYISRITTRPIKELTRMSRKMADGELGQKIKLGTRDEVGELARAFNEMSQNLQKMMNTVSTEKTRQATILASMTDGAIMTDNKGIILLANQAAGALLAFQNDGDITKPLIEVVHDHEIEDLLKLCLESGTEKSVLLDTTHTRHFLRVIAIPINDKELSGALLLFQDLTELRNLQTMRRELVGNISHELRTPIASIKAMVETLQDGAIDDKVIAPDFLARIADEVERMNHIVSELTELSRIETGKAVLIKGPANLNVIIETIIDQLNTLAARRQVMLTTNLSSNMPEVSIDFGRIRETIVNLIDNAIKFNIPGGKVTISTYSDEKSVTIKVADTGIGISRDDLPHIFERFYKVDKSRSGSGSGLGLAIAKHTVQVHGGTIQAQSQQGKGTEFIVNIPL